MCLHPVKIKNQSKVIGIGLNQRYEIEVPCGVCSECQMLRRSEWYFRTYYHCKEIIDAGGYVYFDTLTYAPEYLPTITRFLKPQPKYHYDEDCHHWIRSEQSLSDYYDWLFDEKNIHLEYFDDNDSPYIYHNGQKFLDLDRFNINYSCFDVNDYRHFIVRLRSRIDRMIWDITKIDYTIDYSFVRDENDGECFITDGFKDYYEYFMYLKKHRLFKQYLKKYGYEEPKTFEFDYFLSSEYGTSDKGTHRPHYHILFFIKDNRIPWYEFSKLVNISWSKGRTDGVDYQPSTYVKEHVYTKDSFADTSRLQAVCNYVAKYVNKDSMFQKEIDRRLRNLFNFLMSKEDWMYDDKVQDMYKLLCKNVSQFHRQSKGFGEYYLDQMDDFEIDLLYNEGKVRIPDKKKIVKTFPVFKYYARKVFYEQYISPIDNAKKWRPTELGKQWLSKNLRRNIDSTVIRLESWYNNLVTILGYVDKDLFPNGINLREAREYISQLLDGRSWRDYAMYIMCYKGRVRSYDSIISNKADSLDVIFNNWFVDDIDVMQYAISHPHMMLYNYTTPTEKRIFKDRFLSKVDIGNIHQGINPVYAMNGYNNDSDFTYGDIKTKLGGSYVPQRSFILTYCYNENSDYRFRNFDKLGDYINRINIGYNSVKQNTYDEIEAMKQRLKNYNRR